jgi:WD40 repeat protein
MREVQLLGRLILLALRLTRLDCSCLCAIDQRTSHAMPQASNYSVLTTACSTQVKIWSMKNVATGTAPATVSLSSGTKQQLLAVLSLHNIGVNCVRWSHDGRYSTVLT